MILQYPHLKHKMSKVKVSLGGTTTNHLKEWKGTKNNQISFLGPLF
jgi:hypothetical protein